MAASMDAFASLIADSFAVHQQPTSTRSNGQAGTSAEQQQRQADHMAQQVNQAVAQLKQKMKREKDEQRALQASTLQKHQRDQQLLAAKRRFPTWRLDHLRGDVLSRAWTEPELRHLSTLLLSRNDDVCSCDTASKRRKLDAAVRTSTPTAGCCFARLAHISRAMQRSLADIELQLQAWHQGGTTAAHAAAAGVATPIASLASPAATTPEDIAARWSAHEECDAPSPLAPNGVPRWSAARVYELMASVRNVRDEILLHRRQKLRQQASSSEAASLPKEESAEQSPEEGAPDGDGDGGGVMYELSSSRWSRVGASLHSPQSGLDAHAVYFSTLRTCGYRVPLKQASQPAFYFPPQRDYQRQACFAYEEPPESDEGDAPARSEEDDEDARSEESTSRPAARTQPSPHELLKEVRRLSRRYRR